MYFQVASGDRIAMVLNEDPSIKNPENGITEDKDGSILFKKCWLLVTAIILKC